MYKAIMYVNSPTDNRKQEILLELEKHNILHLCDVKAIVRNIAVTMNIYEGAFAPSRGVPIGTATGKMSLAYFKVTFFDEKAHLLFRLSLIDGKEYKICNPDSDMKVIEKNGKFKISNYCDNEID